ncbi:TlyA family RNA methyltransferase [uncultured Methylibium sp.]|uniref:TlyA family RNA methyltransferase n=1 Tax=uncultured Methylibium sp. TaxID=381093 RepID=UPI0025F42D53|nr:TlyA family RNA methyltransferase [uncultured Methylibium sp.]
MRADQVLVAQGLAPTRSAAQRLIERGAVERRAVQGWAVLRKSGEDLGDAAELRITDDAELRWVSRAGLKLDGALARCGIDVAGGTALDAGQSTGGFTEVLLARGATRVVGVDVGSGQLHPSLRGHAQVTAIEGVNARSLTREALGAAMPAAGFDLVVADLSFIPLTTVLPALVPLLAANGTLLALVKPQFELQPKDIGKGGLVKHAASYAEVETKLREACAALGLAVIDWFDSPVAGGDGNREFFVRAAPR